MVLRVKEQKGGRLTMAITSIMREKIGTEKPLGKITLNESERAEGLLRKATMFIRRNLKKRKQGVTQEEINNIITYLFGEEASNLTYIQGIEEEKIPADFYDTDEQLEDLKKEYKFSNYNTEGKSGYHATDMTWTQVTTFFREQKEPERLSIFIGKPDQFKNNKNGAIYSYREVDGLTFQINLDRLISIGVLVAMYQDIGVIGQSEDKDKMIRTMIHNTLPQSKTQIRKNWGYQASYPDMTREDYRELYQEVNKDLVEGFKRSYRMELNIKSMEDYAKGLGKSVATAFETKKNIPPHIVNAMQQSKFLGKGFKFVELDEDTDLDKYHIVEGYYLDIQEKLPKVPVQALRFRKLGKHRIGGSPVSGLYSPYYKSIAVDLRQFDSFIHEYAHAIDYLYEEDEVQSMKYGFTEILNLYEKYLPKDVENKSYYLTPTEVFARGYEVAFREKYPQLDTGLMKTAEKLSQSKAHQPFYKNKELYEDTIEYMQEYIK